MTKKRTITNFVPVIDVRKLLEDGESLCLQKVFPVIDGIKHEGSLQYRFMRATADGRLLAHMGGAQVSELEIMENLIKEMRKKEAMMKLVMGSKFTESTTKQVFTYTGYIDPKDCNGKINETLVELTPDNGEIIYVRSSVFGVLFLEGALTLTHASSKNIELKPMM